MPCKGPLPQPGDLIEFNHGFYDHWGVCVEDGKVVHLIDPKGLGSFSTSLGAVAVVKEESLADSPHDYKVNNKYDKKADPYPPGKIVKAARMEVGKIRKFDLLKANCEHFVTALRYGIAFCEQAEDAKIGSTVGAGLFAAIIGAAIIIGKLFR
ncbi:phospholipase A and acyltransferase 3-like isoform X2 [Ranitomeya imitator]|uniref:phospholipase A and acyltransferase 3-like isoform X2 n=1 Tax=Ranitomeya imitator TaxID=111125 RepID=UPI0037E72243